MRFVGVIETIGGEILSVQPATVTDSARRSISSVGVLLVVASAFLTSGANLSFRAAMNDTRELPVSTIMGQLLHSPAFYLGWGLYGLAAVSWFRVLKTEPLSSGYPILMGVTFIVVSVGAVLLFDEALSLMKAAGMVIILFGIVLVSRS